MKAKNTLAFFVKNYIVLIDLITTYQNSMNSPEFNIDSYQLKNEYPEVASLFQTLNISEADRKKIQSEFYRIAKEIYGNPKKFSNDTI